MPKIKSYGFAVRRVGRGASGVAGGKKIRQAILGTRRSKTVGLTVAVLVARSRRHSQPDQDNIQKCE